MENLTSIVQAAPSIVGGGGLFAILGYMLLKSTGRGSEFKKRLIPSNNSAALVSIWWETEHRPRIFGSLRLDPRDISKDVLFSVLFLPITLD